MKKKIFILVIAICVLGASYAAFQYNKPHKNIADANSELVIESTELISKFENDREAISNKLLNKVVEVSGIITDFEQSKEQTIIILDKGVKFGLSDEALNLLKGDQINIKGVYSGFDEMFNEISFTQCYIKN